MSQAKVDQYKSQKANRKESMKKEKLQRKITSIVVSVIALAVVVWIGFSAVYTAQNSVSDTKTPVDFSSVNDYLAEISPEEEKEEADDKDKEETDSKEENTEK